MCIASYNLGILLVYSVLQVGYLRLQRVECGLPLISHLEGSAGSSGFTGMGGATRKSSWSGVVGVDNVYCVSLVVLLDAYKGVVTEDGGFGSKLQVELVSNCSDEIVNRLVDFIGGRIRGRGAREGVKLIELKSRLLSVASPSVELVGVGNGGNVEVGKVVLVGIGLSYPQVFQLLSTSSRSLSRMGLQKHTLHAMRETSGRRLKLAGLPPLPMRELR